MTHQASEKDEDEAAGESLARVGQRPKEPVEVLPTKDGLYWIRFEGSDQVEPAELSSLKCVYVIGTDCMYRIEDVEWWGPAIERPAVADKVTEAAEETGQ